MTSDREICGNSGIRLLVDKAFGSAVSILSQRDVSGGRGTFSDVFRLELSPTPTTTSDPDAASTPASVVVKLPAGNVNREAARLGGAYKREATAYLSLLPDSPVRAPAVHAVAESGDLAAFLLEDLTSLRQVDQLDGLNGTDAVAVARALVGFHDHWRRQLQYADNAADKAGIRRSTVSAFRPDALAAGVEAVRERWPQVGAEQRDAFAAVVGNADRLIERFTETGTKPSSSSSAVTLCHGDPRADNLAFERDGRPVLFDWQQLAIQFGEADLAWLGATSLDPAVRRSLDEDLVEAYQGSIDRYRLGLVLPGLAALYLAQRQADHERTRRFIAVSLQRIGTALTDFDVARLA